MAVDKSRIGGLWLVYGIPGTGKTLIGGLADGVIPAIEHGRTVYTNITGLSVAGVSIASGVPAIACDIRFLDTIEDIVEAFDFEECKNALFVLDEMKQVLARDKQADSWLSQRLNIMRKRSNDFIMIAQVPEYFSKEVRGLAKGCTLFKRCFAWGSTTRTQEFRFDGGDPVISSGKLQPAGYSVRTLPKELFVCYKSGIDGLIGVEDNARHNSVFKGPKAIMAYASLFFFVVLICFGVFMFLHIKNSVGGLSSAITGGVAVEDSTVQKKAVKNEKADDKKYCYTRKICDSLVCKTDAGDFPASSWSSVVGGFLLPSGVVFGCSNY